MLTMKTDRDTATIEGLPMGEYIEWVKKTHYAYCYNGGGRIVDQFSFAWEKSNPNMADFLDAATNFIDYYFEEKEYANG